MARVVKRRLQVVGRSTLAVTLPSEWVKRLKLKKGEEVALIVHENSLTVMPLRRGEREKVAEISIDRDRIILERQLLTHYLSGYTTIVIRSHRPLTLDEKQSIGRLLSRLAGLEIVEEKADLVVIKDISDPTVLPVKQVIKKMHEIALSMQMDAVTSLIKCDRMLAEDVISRDKIVDRLYFLVVKQLRAASADPLLAAKLNITPLECLDLRTIAKSIENMGDYAEEIGALALEECSREAREFSNELIDLSKHIYSIHSKAMESLMERDVVLAESVIAMEAEFKEKASKLIELIAKKSDGMLVKMHRVIDNLRRIAECGRDIADIVVP
ncbi:MAG: hypothetical protein DRN96_02350 [Thermoproteota archaeon]|nr:MAG: hypothetical protein DRN96_02350 [Candidatus Korarchaeota archaeon]